MGQHNVQSVSACRHCPFAARRRRRSLRSPSNKLQISTCPFVGTDPAPLHHRTPAAASGRGSSRTDASNPARVKNSHRSSSMIYCAKRRTAITNTGTAPARPAKRTTKECRPSRRLANRCSATSQHTHTKLMLLAPSITNPAVMLANDLFGSMPLEITTVRSRISKAIAMTTRSRRDSDDRNIANLLGSTATHSTGSPYIGIVSDQPPASVRRPPRSCKSDRNGLAANICFQMRGVS
jgi:hypothetical protein